MALRTSQQRLWRWPESLGVEVVAGLGIRRCSALRVLIALLLVGASAFPVGAARVEIVLDASGSMRGSAGGTSKIEAAKQAVKTTIQALDSSSVVALRLYGHRLPSEPKEPSCEDTELVVSFGPLDRERFVAAVDAARPLGQTPLAYSLEKAAADFGDLGDEPAAVILVSDGEESCGGDPAAVACAFAERGLELTIHTVGFDVDAAARAQLQAIAQCTGGEYHDARNAGELADSLQQATQAGLLVDKQRETLGREIRGGDGFGSAVPITPGTYHLDHHQRTGEFDYFSIEVEPGYGLRVSQVAYEVGVQIRGDTFRERGDTWSSAGVTLYGSDGEQIDHDHVIRRGERAIAAAVAEAGEGGTRYLAIGHADPTFGSIHKSSPFTVEILDLTDAGSGTDAGGTDREPVTIAPGEHRAWLQTNGDRDVFRFDADPAAIYGLRVRPEERNARLEMTITDEDGVELASERAPNDGAAVRIEGVRPERAGGLFVAVGWSYLLTGGATTAYSLELTEEDGAVPKSAEAAPEEAEAIDEATAEEAATDSEDRDDASTSGAIPGGLFTCAALLVLALLLAIVLVVVVVMRRKARSAS